MVVSGEDLVLVVNADIVTIDLENPSADSMAIAGNRFAAIAPESEVRAAIGGCTLGSNLRLRVAFFSANVTGFCSSGTQPYLRRVP